MKFTLHSFRCLAATLAVAGVLRETTAQETLTVQFQNTDGEWHSVREENLGAFLGRSSEYIRALILPEGSELDWFIFSGGPLTNIVFPNSMPNLEEILIKGSQLTNIVFPNSMPNLEEIHIFQNIQLTNLTLPEGLTNLKKLRIDLNLRLSNLTLPEGLTNLKELFLNDNALTNVTFPESMPSLERLTLNNVHVGDANGGVNELSTFPGNKFTTLTFPESMPNLNTLQLDYLQLTNLTLPEGLTNLRTLDLSRNRLSTFTLPEGLNLAWLYLGYQFNPRNLANSVVNFDLLRVPESGTGDFFLHITSRGWTSYKWFSTWENRWPYHDWRDGPNHGDYRTFRIERYDPSLPPSPPDEPSLPRGLTYRRLANGLEISWESGVLQKSAGVEGPWENVNASSPLRVSPSLSSEFFRLRAEGSSTPPPNPSLPTDPNPLPEPGRHTLPLNGSLEESIDPVGEEDEYQITVTDSGTLTVYSTGSMDLYGHLLDSSGNELASNDDDGENRNFRISRSVSAGTYYVRVRHYDNSGTGDYGITSRFAGVSRHTLPLNGSLEGSIDPVGEVDVYQITVTDSGTLTVYSTGSMDLYGRLLDDSGNELASNDDDGENRNFRISRSVSAGTYYIRVRHYDNSGTGDYGITSEFRQ